MGTKSLPLRGDPLCWFSIAISVAFISAGIVFPLSWLIYLAILKDASQVFSALSDEQLLTIAKTTFVQSGVSTAVSLGIGLPLGLAIGGRGIQTYRWASILLSIPFGVPTLIAAAAWIALHGLGLGYSLKTVIVAHVFFNAPWIALLVSHARSSISPLLIETAKTLGASKSLMIRKIIWPELSRTVAAAGAQVFQYCAMSFTLVLFLGGGPPVDTLETTIYSKMRASGLHIPEAIAAGLWLALVTLPSWCVGFFSSNRRSRPSLSATASDEFQGRTIKAVLLIICVIFILPYGIPLAHALLNWRALLSVEFYREFRRPVGVSLILAFSVATLSIFVTCSALLAQRLEGISRIVGILFQLPSAFSVLLWGLAFWLAYERWMNGLEGSLILMIGLQITLFVPLVYRILWPVSLQSSTRLLEAAWSLGAGQIRSFFAAEWWRWRGPVWSAWGLVAAAVLGELGAVSLFYGEKWLPLPWLIARLLSQYRFTEAEVLSGILLILSTIILASCHRLGSVSRWS